MTVICAVIRRGNLTGDFAAGIDKDLRVEFRKLADAVARERGS